MFVPTCHRHAWSSDFGRMNYGALPEPYRSEMVQLRIAEVVAENPDPKNQYPLVRGEGDDEGQKKGRWLRSNGCPLDKEAKRRAASLHSCSHCRCTPVLSSLAPHDPSPSPRPTPPLALRSCSRCCRGCLGVRWWSTPASRRSCRGAHRQTDKRASCSCSKRPLQTQRTCHRCGEVWG